MVYSGKKCVSTKNATLSDAKIAIIFTLRIYLLNNLMFFSFKLDYYVMHGYTLKSIILLKILHSRFADQCNRLRNSLGDIPRS